MEATNRCPLSLTPKRTLLIVTGLGLVCAGVGVKLFNKQSQTWAALALGTSGAILVGCSQLSTRCFRVITNHIPGYGSQVTRERQQEQIGAAHHALNSFIRTNWDSCDSAKIFAKLKENGQFRIFSKVVTRDEMTTLAVFQDRVQEIQSEIDQHLTEFSPGAKVQWLAVLKTSLRSFSYYDTHGREAHNGNIVGLPRVMARYLNGPDDFQNHVANHGQPDWHFIG